MNRNLVESILLVGIKTGQENPNMIPSQLVNNLIDKLITTDIPRQNNKSSMLINFFSNELKLKLAIETLENVLELFEDNDIDSTIQIKDYIRCTLNEIKDVNELCYKRE